MPCLNTYRLGAGTATLIRKVLGHNVMDISGSFTEYELLHIRCFFLDFFQQYLAEVIQHLVVVAVCFSIEKYVSGIIPQIMQENIIGKLSVPGNSRHKGKTKTQLHAFSDVKRVVALQRNAGLKPQVAADFLCKRMQAVASAHGDEGFMLKIPGG